MSDSLKDIVSIGQLTGEINEVTVSLPDGKVKTFDLFSFVIDKTVARCLVFSTRHAVLDLIQADNATANITFEGKQIASGLLISIGYEPLKVGSDYEDMMLLHLKRNN